MAEALGRLVDRAVERLLQNQQTVTGLLELQALRTENARLKASLSATQDLDDAEISRLWGVIGAWFYWHNFPSGGEALGSPSQSTRPSSEPLFYATLACCFAVLSELQRTWKCSLR